MDFLRKIIKVGFFLITVMFMVAAFTLIIFAVLEMWKGINPTESMDSRSRFSFLVESIGLLTIAVAALELGETILDEEIRRASEMSVPTRIRRFLSRFLIVIVVALSIEFLVVVFELIHENPAQLLQASALGFATAALLAAWGVFVKLNRTAEELEPEAMEEVKSEDTELNAGEKG